MPGMLIPNTFGILCKQVEFLKDVRFSLEFLRVSTSHVRVFPIPYKFLRPLRFFLALLHTGKSTEIDDDFVQS